MEHKVKDILKVKGDAVLSVPPSATVLEAVTLMNDHHVGSVLVIDEGHPVGIFSERDVLTRVVAQELAPSQVRVSDVMTKRLITVDSNTNVLDAINIVTDRRCRHLPVVDNERVMGVVSIGDLTKVIQEHLREEVKQLSNYIGGPYLS